MSTQEQNTPTLTDKAEVYVDVFVKERAVHFIKPEDISNAFTAGYIEAISDVLEIMSTRPFAMNLELLKDSVKKLPESKHP